MTNLEQSASHDLSYTQAQTSAVEESPLSVSVAVGLAKQQVHSLGSLLVSGEVSGFRGPNARSGHCYFQVKDDASAMDVIVWKSVYEASGIELRDGLELQLKGSFDVYAPTGRLSFQARKLEIAGEGMLRQKVAELARRLQAEGLMDPQRKRPIPQFCTRIAVVTSLSGSVIEDVLRTLRRRNPLVKVQLAGCQVQGPGAVDTIIAALRLAAQAQPDAILLVRGGGSFEDLMTFNDERLARIVAACPVPVICGIGHEPDTSICDMVCDRRASTPTAAAESVAPALDELAKLTDVRANRLAQAMLSQLRDNSQILENATQRISRAQKQRLVHERTKLDALAARPCMASPDATLRMHRDKLALDEQRLLDAMPRLLLLKAERLTRDEQRLSTLGQRLLEPYQSFVGRYALALDALSPLKVLGRGYSIVRDTEGHVVSSLSDAAVGQEVEVMISDGVLHAEITGVEEKKAYHGV
ncbi:MAG: exodeoxyribonuclease VII large subunit [Atopobiaceae bacterium]|nr:exodeoxyribonuclease VII large subunit [Atopobiaceae bacterium]